MNGVILLTEEANIIASRLALRDKGEPDVKAISELAAAESAHALAVCNELGLTLFTIHTPTIASLTDAAKRLLAT